MAEKALNSEEKRDLLRRTFEEEGILLSDLDISAFLAYEERLVTENKVMNLTAITEPAEVYLKHFLDSAILWKKLEEAGVELPAEPSMIDVGSGAGFPGLPLVILKPEVQATLLDALEKRVGFLRKTAEMLDLRGVTAIHMRSEDAARPGKGLRESFDLAVSRAVSQLPVLAEYCLPFVKVGGLFAAYKSGDVEAELQSAEHAFSVLGGKVEQVLSYSLKGGEISRSILLIRKVAETPAAHPRKAGKPEKKPL